MHRTPCLTAPRRSVGLRLVLLLIATACSPTGCPTADPRCRSQLEAIHEQVLSVTPDARTELTAFALKDACPYAMPLGLRHVVGSLTSATPETGQRQPIAPLYQQASYQKAWSRACPAGIAVFEQANAMPTIAGLRHVYRACEVEKLNAGLEGEVVHGFGSEDEFISRPNSPALILPLYTWMLDVGLDPSQAMQLTLNLMGDSPLPQPGAADLDLPRVRRPSTVSRVDTPIALVASRRALEVNGSRVVVLDHGHVTLDPATTRNPRVIDAILEPITDDIDRARQLANLLKRPFEATAALQADRHLPFATLRRVGSTLGHAGIEELQLHVIRTRREGTRALDDQFDSFNIPLAPTTGDGQTVVKLTIDHRGYTLAINGEPVAPEAGCASGATLCPREGKDLDELLAGSAAALQSGLEPADLPAANTSLTDAIDAYPLERLYNALAPIASAQPGALLLVSPGDDIPLEIVLATLEVPMFAHEESRFDDLQGLLDARPLESETGRVRYRGLFEKIALDIPVPWRPPGEAMPNDGAFAR